MAPLSLVGLLVLATLSNANVKEVIYNCVHPPQNDQQKDINFLASNVNNFVSSSSAAYTSNQPTNPNDYWWMNPNSPLKQAYDYYKKCSTKGNCLPQTAAPQSAPGAAPNPNLINNQPITQFHQQSGNIDIGKNPFLNGEYQGLAFTSCTGTACKNGKPQTVITTCKGTQCQSTEIKPADLSANPFLNGGVSIPQTPSNNFIKTNPFLNGAVSSGTVTTGSGASIPKGNGFLGVQPAQPFGNEPKNGATNFGTQEKQPFSTTHPLANKKPFSTVHPNEQGIACSGTGYICVENNLCTNGVVNNNGQGLFQVRSDIQYCARDKEVCCRLPEAPSKHTTTNNRILQLPNLIGGSNSAAANNQPSLAQGINDLSSTITAGKSSIPGSTIKFSGGAGLSPGLIQVLPDQSNDIKPQVYVSAESGSQFSSSTLKPVRATSNPSVFSSTIDYSNTKFDDNTVRFQSKINGPAYLPPISTPSTPIITHRPAISTYQPTIPSSTFKPFTPELPPTTKKPFEIPVVVGPTNGYNTNQIFVSTPKPTSGPGYLPPKPSSPSYTDQYVPNQPSTQRPAITNKPYQPSPIPTRPSFPTYKPNQPSSTPGYHYTTPQIYEPSTEKPYQPYPTRKPYNPSSAQTYPTQKPYHPSSSQTYPTQKPYNPSSPQTYPTQKPYNPSTPQTYPTQKPYNPSTSQTYPTPKPYRPQTSTGGYDYQTPEKPYQPYQPQPQPIPTRPSLPPYQPSTPFVPQPTSRRPNPFIPEYTTPKTYPSSPYYPTSPSGPVTTGYQYPSPQPTAPGCYPGKPGCTPTPSNCYPGKPGCEPTPSNCYPGKPGCPINEHGCYPGKPGCGPSPPSCTPGTPGCPPSEPDCYPGKPGCGTVNPTCYPGKPGCSQDKPNCYPGKPGCPTSEPDCYPGKPGCGTVNPTCYPGKPGCDVEKPSCYPGKPGCGTTPPNCYPGKPGCPSNEPECYPGKPGCDIEKPSCYPGKPGCPLNEPDCYPGKPGCGTVNPTCYPGKPGCEPTPTNCYPGKPGCPPSGPGCYPGKPGCGSTPPSCYPGQPGCEPKKPSCIPGTPGCPPSESGCYPGKPGCPSNKPGCYPGKPGCAPTPPSCYPGQPGCPTSEPGCYPGKPGCGSTPSNCYPGKPGCGPTPSNCYPGKPGCPSSTPSYQPSTPSYQPTTPKPNPFFTDRPNEPSFNQPTHRPSFPTFPKQPPVTPAAPYQPSSTPKPYQPSSPPQPYQPSSPPQPYQPSTNNYPRPSTDKPFIPSRPGESTYHHHSTVNPPKPSGGGYTYNHSPTPPFVYPTPHQPKPTVSPHQYLPPHDGSTVDSTPDNPDNEPGLSNRKENLVPKPTTPRTYTGSPSIQQFNTAPPSSCAAALKCVQEIYCTAEGVVSPVPVVLTKEQELNRVPTTECHDQEAGIIGKCCRDPNYKDPWPSANLVNGVDDGQYKEDPNLGQYSQQKQRLVRSGPRQESQNPFLNSAGNSAPSAENPLSCGQRHQNTKPAGSGPLDVNFSEIPWQAMILRDTNRSLLCGGAIIRRDAVLTAAHCVEGLDTKDVLIKGGEWKLGIDEEPLPFQIVKVSVIVRHPEYRPGSYLNDLAILVLEEKLRPAKNVGTLCLPQPNQIPTQNCIATGWGKRILQLHAKGAIMHSINVNIMEPQQCQQTLSNSFQQSLGNYSPNTLCGYSEIDQCKVDYGSALACEIAPNQYSLSGIYAWDTGCKQQGQIGGYVAPDVEWIHSCLGKPINELKRLERDYVTQYRN